MIICKLLTDRGTNCTGNVSLPSAFYIYCSNFSCRAICFPKHIAIAKTTKPEQWPTLSIPNPQKSSKLGILEEYNQTYLISGEGATSGGRNANDFLALLLQAHGKSTITHDTTLRRLNDGPRRLSDDWRTEVRASDTYAPYREKIITILP